jgi:hypothetical protein
LRAIRQNVLQRVAIVDAADVLEGGRPSARDVRALLDEAHVPRVELGASANAIEPVGAAEILATTTTERTVHARVEAPSLLVLADLFYPGWTADLDGQPTTIVRASLLGRGVVIPAGDHLVTFRYRPRSVVVGATISLVSWLIVAVIAATSIVRRGRRG